MKYFFPVMIALVIMAGVTLTATPYIAEQFFPGSKTTFRTAEPAQVQQALAGWFATDAEKLQETQAIKQVSAQGNSSWFTFKVERQAVENFIRQNRLHQQAMTPALLHGLFTASQPPAPWWQPEGLQRETCFTGADEGREIGLIYHAEQQRGFLVIRTRHKTHQF